MTTSLERTTLAEYERERHGLSRRPCCCILTLLHVIPYAGIGGKLFTMKARDLIQAIVDVSEKAALLARGIRSQKTLFSLLVQEKTGDEKNKRFREDFKTLADVLVQETVKQDLGSKFPKLGNHIQGEESNTFTNALGESITVVIKATEVETSHLLGEVLDGNHQAATLLASIVHTTVSTATDPKLDDVGDLDLEEDAIGIWIDPIDSTAQYIHGHASKEGDQHVYSRGLQAVTVLIGAFDRRTGLPLVGVVNQPFHQQHPDTQQWEGRVIWGISQGGHKVSSGSSCCVSESGQNNIAMSFSECDVIRDTLLTSHMVIHAPGAGYKILCAIDGLVATSILSKGTCFKWDTCSPHTILSAMSGGVVDFRKALEAVQSHNGQDTSKLDKLLETDCQLVYNKPDSETLPPGERWSNAGGIVAYRSLKDLVAILTKLKDVITQEHWNN